MADEVWRRSLRGRLNQLARDLGVQRTDPAELRDIIGDELCRRWNVPGNGTVDAVREKITAGLEDLIQRFVSDDEKLTIHVSFNVPHVPSETAEGWEPNPDETLVKRRSWLWDKDKGRFLVANRTASRTLETFLDNAAGYLEGDQPQPESPKPSGQRRLARQGTAVLATAGVAVGLTALLLSTHSKDSNHTQTAATSSSGPASTPSSAGATSSTESRPASASDKPVLVEGVTPLGATDDASLIYVVPEKIDMTPTDLAAFNKDMSDIDNLKAWMKDHKAIRLGNLTTKITLAGNIKGATATITDIEVIDKQCHTPNEATIFALLGGGDTANTPLTFDLTQQDPHAKDNSGENFFETHSTSLAYGEVENYSVKIKTQAECTFKLQLDVATSSGTLKQTIDDHGQPFLVTSYPTFDKPYSTYQEVYIKAASVAGPWTKTDPKTLP